MRFTMNSVVVAALVLLSAASTFAAPTVPFTETFDSDVSGWENNTNDPLTFVASGGPDGSSFARDSFNFSDFTGGFDGSLIVHRASDSDDASGDAFVGNWIDAGISSISAYVRHDAGEPLSFFFRLASPFNFPAAIGAIFSPAPSGVWTEIVLDVSPTSPQLVSFEGSDYNTVFSNIGNVQIGASIPESFNETDTTVNFDVDNVSTVPEPAALALLALGGIGVAAQRMRRTRR